MPLCKSVLNIIFLSGKKIMQKRKGESLVYSNTGSAILAGAVVVMGNSVGVALEDIAATTGTGMVGIEGVYNVPKVTAAVIAVGEIVIFDVSVAKFDDSAATPATGDITAGAIAVAAGTSSDTTIDVKLTPGAGTIT